MREEEKSDTEREHHHLVITCKKTCSCVEFHSVRLATTRSSYCSRILTSAIEGGREREHILPILQLTIKWTFFITTHLPLHSLPGALAAAAAAGELLGKLKTIWTWQVHSWLFVAVVLAAVFSSHSASLQSCLSFFGEKHMRQKDSSSNVPCTLLSSSVFPVNLGWQQSHE